MGPTKVSQKWSSKKSPWATGGRYLVSWMMYIEPSWGNLRHSWITEGIASITINQGMPSLAQNMSDLRMITYVEDIALGSLRTVKMILLKGGIKKPSCILRVTQYSSYVGLCQPFMNRVSCIMTSTAQWVNHHTYDSLIIQSSRHV